MANDLDRVDILKKALKGAYTTLIFDDPPRGNDVVPGVFTAGEIDPRIVDALIELESGWNPDLVSPDNAIGLGQITLSGKEVAWYEAQTGQKVTQEDLFDPYYNAFMTAYGLAANYSTLQGGPYEGDWFIAALGYFGCLSYDNGIAVGIQKPCGDLYTTGDQYVAKLEELVRSKYGDDAVEELHGRKKPSGGGSIFDRVKDLLGKPFEITGLIVETGKNKVENTVEEIKLTLEKAFTLTVIVGTGLFLLLIAGLLLYFFINARVRSNLVSNAIGDMGQ